MIPRELMQKIRRIQIRTTRIVDEVFGGQWTSAHKGRGIEFEEVRPYQVGDDIRAIDWNVTARTGQPFVKLFREEREMSVILLVDVSPSQELGTQSQTKRDLVTEISATLAFSAIKSNDKVGLTLFTDQIEKSIPPRKGSRHVLRLIRELLYCQPIGQGTSLTRAVEHLNRTAPRHAVVFLVSDFQDSNYAQALKLASRRHDVVPLVVADEREIEMPNVGLLRLRDAETGKHIVLDTASRRHREAYQQHARRQAEQRDVTLRKLRVDPIYLRTGDDFVEPLQRYFRQRERKR